MKLFSNKFLWLGAWWSHPAVVVSALSSLYGKTTRNIATQVLRGTGTPTVDLDRYNLPLDTIEEGWTAEFVQKATESEATVELSAKSNLDHYVEILQLSFPRSGSLGIELEELAGGRSDGIGITLVGGLVEGGSASEASADLVPGDVLSSVALVRRRRRKASTDPEAAATIEETQEEFSVATECLDYDATVDAIARTIPVPAEGFEDTFAVTAKRLRRLPKIRVRLEYPPSQNEPDRTVELRAGENLRQGMLVRGVKLNDPLANRFDAKSGGNCGAGGLCRTCSVCVERGSSLLNPQRLAERQMLGDTPRWRLACKAIVGHGMAEGELVVRVNPNQW